MIDQWYEAYAPEITRYVRSKGFTPEDAEDICSTAFLEAVRRRPADIAPRAWLYLVARNRMIEAWRRAARQKVVSLEPWHDAAVEMPELQDPIPLECLPKAQRAVIEARYIRDWTIAETSAALGLHPASVKGLQHRGLAALRTELERQSARPDPNRTPTIAAHWIGDSPVAEPTAPVPAPAASPAVLPCPPMPDQLCVNGDGRLAFLRLRRRALCASCALLWLDPDQNEKEGTL